MSEAVLARGLAAHRAGRLDEAERAYRKILRAAPKHGEALHCLGIVAQQRGRLAEALQCFDRAKAAGLRSSTLLNNRATALKALGRLEEAVAAFEDALRLAPADAALHYNLGNARMALHDDEAAEAALAKAVSLKPDLVPAWQNLGVVQSRLGRHAAALATYDRLLALSPRDAEAAQKRGEAKLALGRPEEALADFERAAEAAPWLAAAHVNRAWALGETNRREEALSGYGAAIATEPENALAHWNAALAALALGDYRRGWQEWEWRWREPSFRQHRRTFAAPTWRGDFDVAGKTLLLYAEQGFGDTLQFCRYAPLAAERGARVILEAPSPLLPLLRTLKGVDTFIPFGDTLPAHDAQCPLMTLPLAFGTTLETVPARVPYLAPDPERIGRWRDRLGPRARPRVALCWSGNPGFRGDQTRSAPLASLAPILACDCDFVAVQKDIRDTDRDATARFGIRLVADALEDFADSAALVALCDLTITVDSAPAHLAGALGLPVWVLLHATAEWRWLMEREDSPWYPTARLFRQTRPRDWEDLAARVAGTLAGCADLLRKAP